MGEAVAWGVGGVGGLVVLFALHRIVFACIRYFCIYSSDMELAIYILLSMGLWLVLTYNQIGILTLSVQCTCSLCNLVHAWNSMFLVGSFGLSPFVAIFALLKMRVFKMKLPFDIYFTIRT